MFATGVAVISSSGKAKELAALVGVSKTPTCLSDDGDLTTLGEQGTTLWGLESFLAIKGDEGGSEATSVLSCSAGAEGLEGVASILDRGVVPRKSLVLLLKPVEGIIDALEDGKASAETGISKSPESVARASRNRLFAGVALT